MCFDSIYTLLHCLPDPPHCLPSQFCVLFYIFLYSHQYCSYLGCVILAGFGRYTRGYILKKTDSPSQRCYQLSIATWLEVELLAYLPSSCWDLICLELAVVLVLSVTTAVTSFIWLPVVSRRQLFHIAILCLWLLQAFCLFYSDP